MARRMQRVVGLVLSTTFARCVDLESVWPSSFRAVFIWSPGHAGTTTLAQALRSMELPPNVLVDFERTPSHSPISACKVPGACDERRPVSDCSRALRSWVRGQYVPWISRRLRRKSKSLYVHVGHDAATGGVLPELLEYLGARLTLIRFERGRFNMAWSLSAKNQLGPCDLWFSVCPARSCAMWQPREELFAGLGPFQQMLWMLDEMDYQWRALLARAKKLGGRTAEVRWNHTIDATAIGVVVNEIARLQDGRASKSKAYRVAEVPHAKPHVAHADAQWKFDSWAEAQQAEYERAVRAASPPPPYWTTKPNGRPFQPPINRAGATSSATRRRPSCCSFLAALVLAALAMPAAGAGGAYARS